MTAPKLAQLKVSCSPPTSAIVVAVAVGAASANSALKKAGVPIASMRVFVRCRTGIFHLRCFPMTAEMVAQACVITTGEERYETPVTNTRRAAVRSGTYAVA